MSSGDVATAGGDAHIVGVKLGIIGGDGGDSHAGQGGPTSCVSVAADLGLGDSCQGGVGCVEGRSRAQHQLVGIAGSIGAAGKAGRGVVVKADRRSHLYLELWGQSDELAQLRWLGPSGWGEVRCAVDRGIERHAHLVYPGGRHDVTAAGEIADNVSQAKPVEIKFGFIVNINYSING